jgi:drug/metabolite transporter (DMT)-like permease
MSTSFGSVARSPGVPATESMLFQDPRLGYSLHMSDAESAAAGAPSATRSAWFRLAPFVFVALWCSGFSFIKVGLDDAEPMTYLALRHALALMVLLAIAVVVRPPLPRGPADWGHLAVVGALIQFAYFGLCYFAVRFGVSAGGVALIVSLQPILIGLLAPKLIGERVTTRRWIGLGLGLAGAVLVIVARSAIAAPSALGLLSAAGALLAMTVGTLYEKRFGTPQHPLTANLVQYAVGLAISGPLAFACETMSVAWTREFVIALGYLVVASSLISTTLLLLMVRNGEVSRVSAVFFLVPPGAALAAWLIAGEVMPPLAWAGMALAAAGVAVASSPSVRRAPRFSLRRNLIK